jgi:hypothetical protein
VRFFPNDGGLHLCGIWLIKQNYSSFLRNTSMEIWVIVVKKVTGTFAKACWQTTDFNSYNIRVSEIKSLI